MDPVSLSLLASKSPAVIDIDGTFFIQGGLYIALTLFLYPTLFKPWLAAQARRAEAIGGALTKAKSLRQEAEDKVAEYELGLATARDHAINERASRRRAVEAEQAARLAEARASSMETLEAQRAQTAADAETARQGLSGQVGALADTIAAKLLGRSS